MPQQRHRAIPPIIIAVLTVGILGCTQPEGQRLTGAEIGALLGKHTAVGYHERKDFRFQRYFATDGSVKAFNPIKGARSGRWRIDDQGRHCLRFFGAEEHCRLIYRGQDGIYRKYSTFWLGGHRLLIIYSGFAEGNGVGQ